MPRKAPLGLWPLRAKAAIFDFDGTLASTAHLWHEVDAAFLGKRGLPLTKEYPERLAALGFAEGARYTIEQFGLNETVEQICDEWNRMGAQLYRDSVRLRPGAQEYILALRSVGIPCALATTNDTGVLNSMRHIDVDGLFDVRVHGAEVSRGKDHPDIYLEAARRLSVNPQDCIVFEDIVPALKSAKLAGMVACGVHANDPTQDVQTAQSVADLWLDDWRDLQLPTTSDVSGALSPA